MKKARIIIIGGFLGAGKTTLIAKAASYFIRNKKRIGIITNDQAPDLVDTNLLKSHGLMVNEVAGGCFCCRFSDFIKAAQGFIVKYRPEVIFAEPVGSCTDLSATVLQPLKKLHNTDFSVAPYAVLVDPARLAESLKAKAGSLLPECALYIYRKQLEEADLIVLNKSDTLSKKKLAGIADLINREFPSVPVMSLSALKENGIKKWIDFIMSEEPAGRRLTRVNYETYAQGEAALGWLNGSFKLTADKPVDWKKFCNLYLSSLQKEISRRRAEVTHIKLFLKSPDSFLVANLVSNKAKVFVTGNLKNSAKNVDLVVNARVGIEPEDLKQIIEDILKKACANKIKVNAIDVKSFKPGYPKPLHRFKAVV